LRTFGSSTQPSYPTFSIFRCKSWFLGTHLRTEVTQHPTRTYTHMGPPEISSRGDRLQQIPTFSLYVCMRVSCVGGAELAIHEKSMDLIPKTPTCREQVGREKLGQRNASSSYSQNPAPTKSPVAHPTQFRLPVLQTSQFESEHQHWSWVTTGRALECSFTP